MADLERKRLKVSPPIHRLGLAGRWIRSQLQAGILRGTPVLVRIQGLRTPALNTLMQASSFLGEEEFYMLLVSFMVWVVDAKLGRLMVLLMALCFYLTGVLKNLLCLPRPPVPPIIPLQKCQDWSLPSHHAVLNVNVPWFIWFYVTLNYALSPPLLVLLFSLISLWSFCVMFSRVYLGVHSPADILTGGIVGCLLLAFWLQWHEGVDQYLSSSPAGSSVLGLLCVIVLLLCLHPDPLPVTIIYAETVCMVGVAVGFVLGHVTFSSHVHQGLMEISHTYSSVLSIVLCSVLRYMLGLVTLLLMKELAVWLVKNALRLVAQIAGVPTVCVKRRSEVTSEKVHFSDAFIVQDEEDGGLESSRKPLKWNLDNPLNLDIPVKFISYISMGVVAVEICPTLFYWIGI